MAWRVIDRSLAHMLCRMQVTMDAASPERDLLLEVETDHDSGVLQILPSRATPPTTPIIVEASSPGLTSSRAFIQVSADLANDGVLAVASRSSRIAFTS